MESKTIASLVSANKDDEMFVKEKDNVLNVFIPDLIKVAKSMTCMEQINAFKKLCAPIAPTINAIVANKQKELGEQTLPNSLVPHNKKIIPQRGKLYSTKKKKRKPASVYTQPSTNEKQTIALQFLLGAEK